MRVALQRLPAAVGHGAGALRARIGGLSATVRRRLLVAGLLAGLLLTAYYAWFRDSSLVAVEEVTVTGATTDDAARIRSRLTEAAQGMTTLHVDEEALMRALPVGAAVADLRVSTDFPHGMTIEVVQSPAVAVLVAPGKRMAVAADGTVLKGVKAANVPTINVQSVPGRGRVNRGRARQLVAAAAAAPHALRTRIERLRYLSAKGLVAYLARGPQVILGDTSNLAAKWATAAAILADPESRGASYVDVSLPDRPVAGGVDVPQPEPEQPPAGSGAPPTPATPGATPAQPGATPGAQGSPSTPGTGVGTTPGAAGPGGTSPGAGTPGAQGTAPTPGATP